MFTGGGYFAFVAFLYLAQRQFVFHPQSAHPSPAAAGLPEAEEAVVDTTDGARVIVWQVPPRGEKPVVIYFHGNAEIVASRAKRHRQLMADGIGLVALSYRGYMGSTGSPTEDGLLHDAEAASCCGDIRSEPAWRLRSRAGIRSPKLFSRRRFHRPPTSLPGYFPLFRSAG